MFQKILSWIKEVFSKKMLFNSATLKQALGVESLVSPYMADAIARWQNEYVNNASWLNGEVVSLGLPATIASELATSATIEMNVNIAGSQRAEYLTEQFNNSVLPRLREKVEVGLALGGLIMKPYVADGTLAVDFVRADQFVPIAYDDNGKLIGVVFVSQIQKGSYFYNRFERHAMGVFQDESGKRFKGCSIDNVAFRSTSRETLGQPIPLADVPEWADIEPSVIVKNIKKPLFGYFRPPFANNVDIANPSSPLGISCYARVEDLMKQADEQYSRFLWENESAKRALYADPSAFEKGENNKPVLPIKRLYRILKRTGGNIGDKHSLFDEWSPTIRNTELLAGLDAILKKIELGAGLAFGTISDPNSQPLTATEIVMSKQRTSSTITDTQKSLQFALEDLLYAMNCHTDYYRLAPQGGYTTTYEWDDSVVTDHDTQFTQDSLVVGMGAMPKRVFVERNYGVDTETAQKWVAEATEERNAGMSGFFGNSNLDVPTSNPDMAGA